MRPIIMVVGSSDFDHLDTVGVVLQELGAGTIMTSQMGPVEGAARSFAEKHERQSIIFLSDWNERDPDAIAHQQVRMVHRIRPELVVGFWSGTRPDGVVMALRHSTQLQVPSTFVTPAQHSETLKRLISA